MKISRIKNAPIRGIDSISLPKQQPLQTDAGPSSKPKAPTSTSISVATPFNFKADIALESANIDTTASLKTVPAPIQNLNLDALEILQDAAAFEAPKTTSSEITALNFKTPARTGKPAYVYSSGCPCQ